MRVSEVTEVFEGMLREQGFDKKSPDLKLAWRVFKEFSIIPVECAEDALLFQCGTYNFTGERLFYWDLVRQFTFEEDGEYDHMEQFHFEVKIEPHKELEVFELNVWSFDYNDVSEFFSKVEGLKEFSVPTDQYSIKALNIFNEKV